MEKTHHATSEMMNVICVLCFCVFLPSAPQILANGGTPKQKRYAERVAPLRTQQSNLLLVSFVVANVAVTKDQNTEHGARREE